MEAKEEIKKPKVGYIREHVTEYVGNLALLPAALWGLYNIPFFVMVYFLPDFGMEIKVEPQHDSDDKKIMWGAVIGSTIISTLLWSGLGFLRLLFD